jgi:transposase InsO family protein
MTSELADTALRTAIARRRPTGTVIVHTDRGGQFRSLRYQRNLRAHGLTASMGRIASAGANAAMESYFALLQKNVLNRQTWQSREELPCRSSPGSNAPTTGAADSVRSATSLPWSSRPPSATAQLLFQHDPPNNPSTKVWAYPAARPQAATACVTDARTVQERLNAKIDYGVSDGLSLARVAVRPFHPTERLRPPTKYSLRLVQT